MSYQVGKLSLLALFTSMCIHYGLEIFYWEAGIWITHMHALLCLLAIVNILDLRVRDWLTYSDTSLALDQAGIALINEQANLGIHLIHDEGFNPRVIPYGDLPEHVDHELRHLLNSPHSFDDQLSSSLIEEDQYTIERLDEYLELRILPNLPYISNRPQVGLFAIKTIPKDIVFIWKSDVLLQRTDQSSPLPISEQINKRPLGQVEGGQVIQSGGLLMRSNPITLINFSWCHTESVDMSMSPYRLLPPNDLGKANVHFGTIRYPVSDEIGLSSAVITFQEIQSGDQLLAYSGSGRNIWVITCRRALSTLVNHITPALVITPLIRLVVRLVS